MMKKYALWTAVYLGIVIFLDVTVFEHSDLNKIWYFLPAIVATIFAIVCLLVGFFMNKKRQPKPEKHILSKDDYLSMVFTFIKLWNTDTDKAIKYFKAAMNYENSYDTNKCFAKCAYVLVMLTSESYSKKLTAEQLVLFTYAKEASESDIDFPLKNQITLKLADFYYQGIGTDANDINAFYWMSKAANEYNDPFAQFQLGCFHEKGIGTPINTELAIYWYKKSAENSYPNAYYILATCYGYGIMVEKDIDMALIFARKAQTLMSDDHELYNFNEIMIKEFSATQIT